MDTSDPDAVGEYEQRLKSGEWLPANDGSVRTGTRGLYRIGKTTIMVNDDPLLRTLLVILVAIVLFSLLTVAFAVPMMGMWGGSHMWNGGMWGGTGVPWVWPLMWLIFLAIISGIGYLLYRALKRPPGERTDPALEELRAAYARGELSDEEFEKRRERLQREQ
jgi:putative membrane protein